MKLPVLRCDIHRVDFLCEIGSFCSLVKLISFAVLKGVKLLCGSDNVCGRKKVIVLVRPWLFCSPNNLG